MTVIKTILVTGATGRQGGAVVKHCLREGFSVKALVRNPENFKAKNLASQGVELIAGDLSHPESFTSHLHGIDGVFSVQSFAKGAALEQEQGFSIAKAAQHAGVKHFVYSSVVGAHLNTGIPHWQSKYAVEEWLRSQSMPFTILRPASFYENLLLPQVYKDIKKGKLTLPTAGETRQHMIAVDDVGRVAASVFSDPGSYTGKTLTLAATCFSGTEVSAELSEALHQQINFQKLPPLITRLFLGKMLYTMFRWIDRNYKQLADSIDQEKFEYSSPILLKDWARQHFETNS